MPRRVLRPFGFATLGCAAVLLLTACGGVDTAKRTFPRTTIPGATEPDAAIDPRLAADRLRLADPCALLGKLALDRFGGAHGKPSIPVDPGDCDQDLGDGKQIGHYVEVQLGTEIDPEYTKLSSHVEGLPASESNSGECSEKILTDSHAKRGIWLRYVDGRNVNCPAARTLAAEVIRTLRQNPPQRAGTGSVTAARACETVDGGTLKAVLGETPAGKGTGLFDCTWRGGSFGLELAFQIGEAQSPGDKDKVDLGNGIAAKKQAPPGAAGCELTWAHKPLADGQSELVTVSLTDELRSAGDICPKAAQVAKLVVGKLPKP
ncbi:hypothetical protein [Sciscionella sediminilitoris]|uniref:hypothetical protein n=1 Tax=Sciscionella sediminilitoris TaxID=1445613 RepID=UPI0012E10EB2|nr:hypothetical protein [Sciscionella sp. SE31]